MTVRGSEIVTGLFVVAALAVFVYLAIAAGAGQARVPCVANFSDSIGQLSVGQVVSIKGLPVGKVTSLSPIISPDATLIRVEFEINTDIADLLTDTTEAKVISVSMLGGNILELVLNSTGGKAREENGFYVIEHSEGPFDMFGMLEDFGGKIDPIIKNVDTMVAGLNREVLDPESLGRLHNMIKNLNEGVETLAQAMPNLEDQLLGPDGSINRINRMLDETFGLVSDVRGSVIPDLKQRLELSLSNLDTLLGETTGLVAENRPAIKGLLKTTNDVVAGVGADVSKVETTIAGVGDDLNATLTDARGVLNSPDLHGALYELRKALQEVKLLSMSLRADPSQLVFGGSGVVQPASPADVNRTRSRTEIRAPRYGN